MLRPKADPPDALSVIRDLEWSAVRRGCQPASLYEESPHFAACPACGGVNPSAECEPVRWFPKGDIGHRHGCPVGDILEVARQEAV